MERGLNVVEKVEGERKVDASERIARRKFTRCGLEDGGDESVSCSWGING